MSRWLITHFAPFAGHSKNSSAIVASILKKECPEFLFTESLPVSFSRCWPAVQAHLEREDVCGILALGQAEGRTSICLERVALNWIDAAIPDADGVRPIDQVITLGASDLWTELPVRAWINPHVQISYSAGTYVCNYLYYRCLEWAEQVQKPALFVHIPLLTSQTEAVPVKMDDAVAHDEVKRLLEQLP